MPLRYMFILNEGIRKKERAGILYQSIFGMMDAWQ